MTSENTRKSIYGIRKYHSSAKDQKICLRTNIQTVLTQAETYQMKFLLLLYKNMLLVDDDSILTIIIIAIDHVFVRYMKLRLG